MASTARIARKIFPPATFQRVCTAADTLFPGTCAGAEAVPAARSPAAIPLDVVLTVANAATAVAVWALLEAGAPCVPPDEFGRTCMHYVGAAGNGLSAGMLVRRFPRMVMARDVFGRTAAQTAAGRCHAVACRVRVEAMPTTIRGARGRTITNASMDVPGAPWRSVDVRFLSSWGSHSGGSQ